jgi:hypothetical protein
MGPHHCLFLTFNELCCLPNYIQVSCLDTSMPDTKNLEIF